VLPDHVERVFAAGPPASILLYTLAPEKLIGWNRSLRDDEKPFIAQAFRDLPEVGRLTGRGNTANTELVLKSGARVILDYGSLKPVFRSLADRTTEKTGIPYLLMDGRFDHIPGAYRRLGEILGQRERAEKLASYAEKLRAAVATTLARVPAEARPRVYYARGPDGLETGARGAINVELLDVVGANNVAGEFGERRGLVSVSQEQILKWDPEVILTLDQEFYARVSVDPLWRNVRAVRNHRVYLAPRQPFGWFDRPPSVNRLIGIQWLLATLYPRQATIDLNAATREFYELFYHVTLTDAQLAQLLTGAR